MRLSEWLNEAPGRANDLARHFGITGSAVSQWQGNGVPKCRMDEVEKFTGGAVTVRDMAEQITEKIISQRAKST